MTHTISDLERVFSAMPENELRDKWALAVVRAVQATLPPTCAREAPALLRALNVVRVRVTGGVDQSGSISEEQAHAARLRRLLALAPRVGDVVVLREHFLGRAATGLAAQSAEADPRFELRGDPKGRPRAVRVRINPEDALERKATREAYARDDGRDESHQPEHKKAARNITNSITAAPAPKPPRDYEAEGKARAAAFERKRLEELLEAAPKPGDVVVLRDLYTSTTRAQSARRAAEADPRFEVFKSKEAAASGGRAPWAVRRVNVDDPQSPEPAAAAQIGRAPTTQAEIGCRIELTPPKQCPQAGGVSTSERYRRERLERMLRAAPHVGCIVRFDEVFGCGHTSRKAAADIADDPRFQVYNVPPTSTRGGRPASAFKRVAL